MLSKTKEQMQSSVNQLRDLILKLSQENEHMAMYMMKTTLPATVQNILEDKVKKMIMDRFESYNAYDLVALKKLLESSDEKEEKPKAKQTKK